MAQRIVNIRYSADTHTGRRTFHMQYVGVSTPRARALFLSSVAPLCHRPRILSITRLR